MGKSFSLQSALILFWLLFFITVKFCSAHFASSATHQSFPENEGKPENENLGNKGSVNHIEEDKFKSIIKKLFSKKPLLHKPFIFKKPFIQVPPGISHIQRFSSKPSFPTFEEKPQVQMVKRPNFLLIPFLKNLFPIMKNKPQLQRPTLKPIPFVKTPKFLPFPKFIRPIPIIKKLFPAMEKHIPKFVSKSIPIIERPIPELQKPILEPIPTMEKPFPKFEKPISEPIPTMEKSFPEFEIPEFEKPISKSIPTMEKSFPEFEKPILEPIPATKDSFPEFEEAISDPIPPMNKQIPSTQKLITNNEKSMPISKKDLLLPQLAHTTDPELKLKEYLFKNHIPKIPFPPKFKKPLPAHKPNALP